jgi:hypothetical protein
MVLDIHFFMSLPHFFTTMAFFKTTKTLFFLNMAQIKCLCHFLYPIKRVTLFRHVLWTQICGLVMLWWGTVISRCVTVLHFFMTMPHLYMSTTSFHMTNPHIKWLWHFFCASVISTSANVVSDMYLFIFFFSPCHFLCWLWLKNYDFATFTNHHDQKKMTVHRNVLTLAHINDYVSLFFWRGHFF